MNIVTIITILTKYTMKTTTIIHQIGIHLPKEQVWKKIADFGNICHGHPVVKKSYITSEQKQ
jgi:hypothetical protein